ncbi:ADOP family duplicated permease [Pinirhizobacter soli]|uniref:ADOP family duplicated permease n=1 Tax=Pinirhizobacter soli TaxID=2786953 RepID=UPI00202A508E|nr:ADOP family duplicated permease [Pinirhizobacter soli]
MRPGVLWAEVRQAWRGLLRKPAYLLLAGGTLALGVGTMALVFSLMDQALLKPLAFPAADHLVAVGLKDGDLVGGAPGLYGPVKSIAAFSSSGMVTGWARNTNIAGNGNAQVVTALYADGGFLQTLGRPMAIGRNFNADEDRPKGPQGVILSHDMWQRRFGADPSVLGRTVDVEGKAVPVIGVLPAGFEWNSPFDMILPLQPDLGSTNVSVNEYIVARLAPGASLAGADAEAGTRLKAAALNSAHGDPDRLKSWENSKFGAVELKQAIFSEGTDTLKLFLGAALCVLVIAAVNLANLMLLRALARSHDGAVRAALGAPWLRLALPSLAEGLLVGLLGGVLGVVLAWVGLRVLASKVPPEWMRAQALGLSATTVVFAFGVALLVAVLAACMGIWRAHRQALVAELVGGGRSGLSRESGRLGRVLVVVQVATAVVLLSGAALFLRSLQHLAEVPLGFESRAIATFTLAPVRESSPDSATVILQTRRILDALAAQPGVVRAAASTNLPTGSQFNMSMRFPDGSEQSAQYRPATPGFFELFGIPLVAGRGFDPLHDVAGGEAVCVVSQAFVRDYLHGGNPIGQIVTLSNEGSGKQVPMRVVGVVGDVRQDGPGEPAPGVLYLPFAQVPPATWVIIRGFMPLRYAVQAQPGSVGQLQRDLQKVVEQVAPQQPIGDVQSMEQVVASTTDPQKLNLLLVGIFSALALLLAAVGLYAVTAVTVAARTADFGVRAAMGATPQRLAWQVLGQSARQVALGLGIGLLAALALSRLVQHFLFGVGPADPLALAAVVIVLALAAVLASLVPALRASRVSPMEALRA